MEKIVIMEKGVGKRIDKFFAEEFFLYSRSEIVKKIKEGKVLLNGKEVKPKYILEEGDEVKIEDFSHEQKKLLPNEKIKIKIVFEDENILVINKPAGLQVHPSDYQQTDTLTNALLSKYSEITGVHDGSVDSYLRPGIVHRLDKDTSGVMVIAKSIEAFDELKKLFKSRHITKKYLAVVCGEVEQDNGVIEKPMARSAGFSKQIIARENTKTKIREATTHYAVIKRYEGYSLLEVVPKTGRMHQIRVHLASLNYPIVGDVIYGSKISSKIDKKIAERQLLHAKTLSFNLGEKHYKFSVKMPKDFKDFLDKLKEK